MELKKRLATLLCYKQTTPDGVGNDPSEVTC